MSSITADEYRTAAKVDRHHGGQSAAQFYEDNARALESEDLVTQVAMQFAGSTWGGRDAEEQFALAGSERALAYLVGAGRLVPAGGMALTAEQVEDVRIVLGLNGSQDIKVVLDAQARLRALFPATEPAEEETKAEDESGWHWVQSAGGYYSGPACTGGYGCRSRAHYEGCLRPSLTASSPVVPAPTETGPWT